jgi:DNA-binding transcriptional LysR family regulator
MLLASCIWGCRRLDLEKLRVFAVVAEHEHFSRAAEALCVSQPAVSTQVRELERQLGVVLFERHGRGVRLTAAGRLVQGYARRLHELSQGLDDAVADYRTGGRQRLRVGASTTPGSYLLPSILRLFYGRHPSTHVTVEIANTALIVKLLHDGDLSLALLGESVHDSQVVTEPWLPDSLCLIVPPGHRWIGATVCALDLAHETLIGREPGSATDDVITRSLAQTGSALDYGLVLSDTQAVKQAVMNGLGVAFVSRCAVNDDLAQGRLGECLVEGLTIERTFQLATRRGSCLTEAEQAFLSVARHVAQNRSAPTTSPASALSPSPPT